MRIVELKRADGVADAVSFTVTGALDDRAQAEYFTHIFVGSLHGTPGPVVLVLSSGMQTTVIQPERFGVRFNEDWVRRFYSDFSAEETTAHAEVSEDGGNE